MWQDNLLVSLDPLTLSCAAESSIKTRLSLVLEGWVIQSGLLFGVYSVSCHSYWAVRSESVPNRNLYTRICSLIARRVFVIVDGRIREGSRNPSGSFKITIKTKYLLAWFTHWQNVCTFLHELTQFLSGRDLWTEFMRFVNWGILGIK